MLSWTQAAGGGGVICNAITNIETTVKPALASGEKIKAFGTRWLWNTVISGDGVTYLILSNDPSDISEAKLNTTDKTMEVDSGIQSFDLFMLLQTINQTLNHKSKSRRLTATKL